METKWLEDDKFFDQMDANVMAVYVVEEYDGIERRRCAIFSTKAKADQWMKTQEGSCVCCPYVIDEPDFGNVRPQ